MKTKILDVAQVIRSKNAGPFELTMDIVFKNRAAFDLFRQKKVLTEEKISSLFCIGLHDISGIIYFEAANAVKITIKRPLPSGAPGDSDIYGAQQHAPLLNLEW
ncbi:MAG: DUF4387 domain-containing protein [Deltaproteobacteria bacterium]|jgi:hypothetical protein|nr:DUF4387 domain-containing protein [Deltaproteobacteria bacterium]MBT4265946.1 DUF4387 domain-containing protein [Deltaproteobacteria bacterium]MBT4637598.1 DUF4387 domain-containing protein [Deltaproteobacteria bacterium]MBT6498621.1 DUF4387 domain-containing protein [Deltaproteobacteria bacterium]MBT6613489.1 DUF4387 domain-containing protein [Deltaproteobacteria bacterium]